MKRVIHPEMQRNDRLLGDTNATIRVYGIKADSAVYLLTRNYSLLAVSKTGVERGPSIEVNNPGSTPRALETIMEDMPDAEIFEFTDMMEFMHWAFDNQKF